MGVNLHDPIDLEVIRQYDQDLELLAVAHNDLGEMFEVTWHRQDGSILRLLTRATGEARAYLSGRPAKAVKSR
jgi:hypothetical protein